MATAKKDQNDEKNKLTSVEFIKPWGRYSKGDVAGFDSKQAEKLKSAKVAVNPGEAKEEPESKEPAA